MGKGKEKPADPPVAESKKSIFNDGSFALVQLPSGQIVPVRGCYAGGKGAPAAEVATAELFDDSRAPLELSGLTVVTLDEFNAAKAAGEFGGNPKDDTDPAQGYALVDAVKSKALWQTTQNG